MGPSLRCLLGISLYCYEPNAADGCSIKEASHPIWGWGIQIHSFQWLWKRLSRDFTMVTEEEMLRSEIPY